MNIVKADVDSDSQTELTEEECRERIGPIILELTKRLPSSKMFEITTHVINKCGRSGTSDNYQCIINEWEAAKAAFIKHTGIHF